MKSRNGSGLRFANMEKGDGPMTLVKKALLLAALMLPAPVWTKEVPLKDFYRDAAFDSVELSPDGKHIAVIIPQEDRTILAVVRVVDKKLIGKWDYGERRHFYNVVWANDHRLLFWVGFKLGKFDFQISKGDLYASNIDGTGRIDIPNGATYGILDTTPEDPDNILVQRSVESTFLFKLNVNNGRITPISSVPIDAGRFMLDHHKNVRYAFGQMDDGTAVTYRRDGAKWTLIHTSSNKTTTYIPVAMAEDDKHVLLLRDDKGAPTRLMSLNPETNEETLISSGEPVDPSGFIFASDRKTLLAVGYLDGTPVWDFVNSTHPEAKIYAGLIKSFPGMALSFNGASSDGRYISFSTYNDRSPGEAYLFDTTTRSATYLLSARDWIKPDDMSEMRSISLKSRDGATLYGYLTVPNGSSGKNLPLIVNPHGGPHYVRDNWGYQPEVQMLANRGYAVLQLNYRGSGGYGDAYQRAGFRKWGTLMQDDLTDAVRFLVSQGTIDKDRICIYGGSYGGYAALMSVEREPDLYKCAVGYAGVYDLDIQRTQSDTSQSESGMSYLNEIQPSSVAERRAQSPAYNVDRIKVPVMLVHGEKDVRVPIKHMHVLIDQMAKVGKKPELVITEPKEGHGFQDEDHQISLYEKMLPFFDKYIGPNAKAVSAGAQ